MVGAFHPRVTIRAREPRRWHQGRVVMPAYSAGRTLRLTYAELRKDHVSLVILVDDGSTDHAPDVAREPDLEVFVHNRKYGYGAKQKTCYTEALRAGAESS